VRRWLTEPLGETGWQALEHAGTALAAMAGVAAVGGLLCLVPALQALGRDLLRYGAVAVAAIAAWKLLDPPGANDAVELRHGALAAAGCALVLLTCAMGAANAPLRRKHRRSPVPPAPVAYGTTGSNLPPS
jgi:hypothetical protein